MDIVGILQIITRCYRHTHLPSLAVRLQLCRRVLANQILHYLIIQMTSYGRCWTLTHREITDRNLTRIIHRCAVSRAYAALNACVYHAGFISYNVTTPLSDRGDFTASSTIEAQASYHSIRSLFINRWYRAQLMFGPNCHMYKITNAYDRIPTVFHDSRSFILICLSAYFTLMTEHIPT